MKKKPNQPTEERNQRARLCRLCKEQIRENAKKCASCGAFQSRIPDIFFNNTYSFVFTLISGAFAVMSYLNSNLLPKEAEILVSVLKAQEDWIQVEVENIGTRYATIFDAYSFDSYDKTSRAQLRLGSTNERAVKVLESSSQQFPLVTNGSYVRRKNEQGKMECGVVIFYNRKREVLDSAFARYKCE